MDGLTARLGTVLLVGLVAACSARPEPPATPADALPATPPAPAVEAPSPLAVTADPAATPAKPAAESPPKPRISRMGLCSQAPNGDESTVETARRRLHETACAATLWLDGLFGDELNVENARSVYGRLELSALHSDYEGADLNAPRFSLRYDLPNWKRRFNAFLGRDDPERFVADRLQGASLRSPFFDIETEERWLAGFGYAPPPGKRHSTDFRVGVKVKESPELFVQARSRFNLFVDQRNAWRLRETPFWTNNDGFGLTSSLDYDRAIRDSLLLRWGTVATISEATEGFYWRSAWILYHDLQGQRAMAYETFIRGNTDGPVDIREYGVRSVYRQSVFHRWLFGEVVLGYTWPRVERNEKREGSFLFGFALELFFGRDLP